MDSQRMGKKCIVVLVVIIVVGNAGKGEGMGMNSHRKLLQCDDPNSCPTYGEIPSLSASSPTFRGAILPSTSTTIQKGEGIEMNSHRKLLQCDDPNSCPKYGETPPLSASSSPIFRGAVFPSTSTTIQKGEKIGISKQRKLLQCSDPFLCACSKSGGTPSLSPSSSPTFMEVFPPVLHHS